MITSQNLNHSRFFHWRPFIIVSASFLAGGLIYLFFRQAEPSLLKIFKIAGIDRIIVPVRHQTLKIASFLPEWFIYSLPDAIWSFSYALLITLIWWRKRSTNSYLWLSSIPVLIAGIEILQIMGIFPGTFTLPDLLFELAGMMAGIFTGINHLKIKYNEKSTTPIDFKS